MSTRRDYVLNTAAGLLNAAEAVAMSMITTRVTNLADAGILTIAFAVGNLLMAIGKFGMRPFQVTDLAPSYRFSEYLASRVVTTLVMVIGAVCYTGYSAFILNDDRRKCVCILMICAIYAVESLEDVFWGFFQQEGHLAAGARLFCMRWGAILITFLVSLIISKDLALTLTASFLISVAVFTAAVKSAYSSITRTIPPDRIWTKIKPKRIAGLCAEVFPLFGVSFLSFYVINSPKYAIDFYLSSEVQACYGFIAMPVFVIGMLNSFIYQPTLVEMSNEWNRRDKRAFKSRIIRQMVILAGIMCICIAGAWILGIPVLSWLYSTDLTGYKRELLILLVAGGFLAGSGYLNIVLTTMRRQKYLLAGYAVVAAAAFLGMHPAVAAYGTTGAAVGCCVLMLILCGIYCGIIVCIWNRE